MLKQGASRESNFLLFKFSISSLQSATQAPALKHSLKGPCREPIAAQLAPERRQSGRNEARRAMASDTTETTRSREDNRGGVCPALGALSLEIARDRNTQAPFSSCDWIVQHRQNAGLDSDEVHES
jgi:hypothetical protein